MHYFARGKKFIVGFVAGLLLLSGFGTASASLTQEDFVRAAMMEKVNAHDKLLEQFQRLQWYGDLRLRYEIRNRADYNNNLNDADSHIDTHRPRYRFRFGAKAHAHKDLDLVFRLSTGGNQGTSGNQTMDGTFDQDSIDLNLAYASYDASRWLKGLTLQGGKVKNKFMESEVVWDRDVNFEGLTQILKRSYGSIKVTFVLGQYIVEETDKTNGTPTDDIILYGYQTQLQQKTGFGKFKFAVSFYNYADMQRANISNQLGAGDAQRNALSGTQNRTDIQTLDLMGEWSTKLGSKAFKFFGEYAKNLGADVDKSTGRAASNSIADDLDTAWQLGAQYGHKKFKKFGNWKVKAMYRVVQQDAVFYALADSDFHGGGTNAKGIKLQAKMALRKGVDINYTFMDTKNERGDLSGGKFDIPGMHQFDLKFKF